MSAGSGVPTIKSDALASGVEGGVAWATHPAPLYGAVNGYVRIPEGHPWQGMECGEVPVDAHGGLTYRDGDWYGFDTLHWGDSWPDSPYCDTGAREWTPRQVEVETIMLARRVASADGWAVA